MSTNKPTLSVVIITKNEERDLPRCLRSVWFADEIVVLDSGSMDRTLEIAREFTDKVFVNADWPGFGPQKNRALTYATGEWVLSLDADEWVTAELAEEIQSVIKGGAHSVYKIPRLSSFCGVVIRRSGWYPDYVTRLFRKSDAQFSKDLVHERVVHEKIEGSFNNPLRHASYHDLNEVMNKVVRYSQDGAENRFRRGETTSFSKALLSTFWAFLRTWVLRLGFLDGKPGFMVAVSIAEGTYWRHMRLLEIQQVQKIPSVALIVTTFNRPDAMECVLESIEGLQKMPDEVVIADDGSGEETRDLIEHWKKRLPLQHVWHEDQGFRAAAIRNRAVAATKSDYLIFLDGDCLVDPTFVDHHLQLSERSSFVPGSRILMSQELTHEVLSGQANVLSWGISRWLWARVIRHANRMTPFVKIPDGVWRKWRKKEWRGVRTCNLGLWRKDFDAVNGFDEEFHGWGHEDADLAIRLIRNGVFRKDGNFGYPVVHLWHSSNRDFMEPKLRKMLQDSIDGLRPIRAMKGGG